MNKLSYFVNRLLLFASAFIILSCGNNNHNSITKSKTTIAITKAHGSNGYEQYKKWILELDSNITIYDLYDLSLDSANKILKTVDGLLVSGGPDVNPHLYGEDSMKYLCETPDDYRDSLEIQSIEYAYKHKLAILGICRGQQIINVYFGGSLINDIPSQIHSQISHRGDTAIAYHNINIVKHSYLQGLYTNDSAWVNSSHHQAVKRLGKGLEVYAYANDSIV
jgi:putative glutamine amidotransferase